MPGKLGEGRDSGMNGHRRGRIVVRLRLIQRRLARDVVVHFRILCYYGANKYFITYFVFCCPFIELRRG